MCIAVYKPQGAKFPSKKKMQTMFRNNPDGAGFAYADGKKVVIQKGFMTLSDFNRALNKVKHRTDLPFMLHFRITTHGATSQGLTHPFPVSDDLQELTATRTEAGAAVIHNGMIPLTGYAKKLSDTAEFIRRYMTKLCKTGYDADILTCIEELIHSKMVILEANKNAHLLGDFVQDGNGVYYSNDSYKPIGKKEAVKVYTFKPEEEDPYHYHACFGVCEYCKYERDCIGYYSLYNPYAPDNYNAQIDYNEMTEGGDAYCYDSYVSINC